MILVGYTTTERKFWFTINFISAQRSDLYALQRTTFGNLVSTNETLAVDNLIHIPGEGFCIFMVFTLFDIFLVTDVVFQISCVDFVMK